MQNLNYDENSKVLNHKDEVISFKCELQENLQKALKEFVEENPNWDQYRILQAAIAGFLMQKGFQNRLSRGLGDVYKRQVLSCIDPS